jgi:hypothetical protein
LRTLLDDSRDWYAEKTPQLLIEKVNQAMQYTVNQAIAARDMRALRPLIYTATARDFIGNPVSAEIRVADSNGNIRVPMYPQSCRITFNNGTAVERPGAKTIVARYLQPELFRNFYKPFQTPTYGNGVRFPQDATYTIERQYRTDLPLGERIASMLYLNAQNPALDSAEVRFIAYPLEFRFVPDTFGADDVPIELPKEYHSMVIGLAAELLNTRDVAEQVRGIAASPSQDRMTLQRMDAQ